MHHFNTRKQVVCVELLHFYMYNINSFAVLRIPLMKRSWSYEPSLQPQGHSLSLFGFPLHSRQFKSWRSSGVFNPVPTIHVAGVNISTRHRSLWGSHGDPWGLHNRKQLAPIHAAVNYQCTCGQNEPGYESGIFSGSTSPK